MNGCCVCNFGDSGYCEFCPSTSTSTSTDPRAQESPEHEPKKGRIREWWARAAGWYGRESIV